MMIRSATPADARELLDIYRPFVTASSVTFELDVPPEAEFRQRIEKVLAFAPWLVAEIDGRIAGYAYATRHRERIGYQWSVESSVYVHPEFHRRGLGRALYGALFPLLRDQGFVNVYAGIALPNAASVALHESFGFEPVGVYRKIGFKLGRWVDVGWWSVALREPPADPIPPRIPGP